MNKQKGYTLHELIMCIVFFVLATMTVGAMIFIAKVLLAVVDKL